MAYKPIPLHLRIAAAIVVLLMTACLIAIIWFLTDIEHGALWFLGGVIKGLLIPIPMLFLEHKAVIRRDIRTSLIVAIGWLSISVVIGWQFTAMIMAMNPMPEGFDLLFRLIPPLATTLVPVYVGLSHLHWWRSLRNEKSQRLMPTDSPTAG